MIIYIHGFAGSGCGSKATILKYKLSTYNHIIAPTLSYVPILAIDTLCQLIESYQKYEEVYLIGSSLGGYYSVYLSIKYNLKATLINPSINPTITLSKMLGSAMNYGDSSHFEWNENHLQMLEKYKISQPKKENFLLLTQTGDELLDYKVGVEYLKDSKQIIVKGGDHSFVGIENYLDEIVSFFKPISSHKA